MLRESGLRPRDLRGPGQKRPADAATLATAKPESVPAGAERAPPFFWASFVLSGDWR